MNIHIIFHKDISRKTLLKVATLKNSEWKHGLNSNFLWLKENMKNKDIHILIKKRNNLLAYNCLRLKKYTNKNNKNKKIYIFDSMIVKRKYRKQGLGRLINDISKIILKKYKIPGFLICNKKNINFYKRSGWSLHNKKGIIIKNHYSTKNRMIFNLNSREKIKYIIY